MRDVFRQLTACLTALAFGLMVPAMAAPVRICLTSICSCPDTDCCKKNSDGCCDEKPEGDDETSPEPSCCVAAPTLPESMPSPEPQLIPELHVIDLGWSTSAPPHRIEEIGAPVKPKARIRGPTLSPTFRPLLAIWRL